MPILSNKDLATIKHKLELLKGRSRSPRIPIPPTISFKDKKKESKRTVCRKKVSV